MFFIKSAEEPTCWLFRTFDDSGMRSYKRIFGCFCKRLCFAEAALQAYSIALRLSTSKQYSLESSKVRKTQHALRRWGVQTGKATCQSHRRFLH
jgi:hypothetical protein